MINDIITLIAVGDISPGDHYFTLGHGVRSVYEEKGGDFLFAEVKALFGSGDIVFCNLEGVLSDVGLDRKSAFSYGFRGNPVIFPRSLKEAGIDIANIANNHILQHGQECFGETIDLLKKSDIYPLGIKSSNDYSSTPIIKKCKGLDLGFLGYSFVEEQYHPQNVPYSISSIQDIKLDINNLSQRVDIVVLSCHFGLEVAKEPSLQSVKLMHSLVDAGADIIIGHHPHVVQSVEIYKEKLILYSLGDFIFDLFWDKDLLRGSVAEIRIKQNKKIDVKMHPILINKLCQPVPEGDEKIFDKYNTAIHSNLYRKVTEIEHVNYSYYHNLYRRNRSLNFKKLFYYFTRLPVGNTKLKLDFLLKKIVSMVTFKRIME